MTVSGPAPVLRVGRIAALNMYPLYHHLELAGGPEFAFTDGVPTTLNRALISGQLDVSAMSSIEFARHSAELELVPVACISASGAVDSILVFSRVPFAEIASVAVTPHSATSVALLRVLLGPEPEFVPLAGPPPHALTESDAVLLIGDEALEGGRAPFAPYATDLGERWRARTGLPMVFAVWAARADLAPAQGEILADLRQLLTDAQEQYACDPEAVVRAAARRFPFPEDFIAAYFRRLGYGFGATERQGLKEFLRLARDAGQLAQVPELLAAEARRPTRVRTTISP
jgi:chorismate dehydratase